MENNKTAVVTGASRGIGKAICLELAKNGVNIVVNYVGNKETADQVVKECETLGVKAISVMADVSKSEQVEALIAKTVEEFGSVDILVNNAGITRDNLLMRMTEQEFDDVIATNLKGAYLCMKAVSRLMMKKRSGKIINISSVVGLCGNAGQINYAASKAGVIGMTKSLAKELASRGVNVNAVAPGFIETDMTSVLPENIKTELLKNIPFGRLGSSMEVANAVAFLAGEKSDYITGQVLTVDGGMVM